MQQIHSLIILSIPNHLILLQVAFLHYKCHCAPANVMVYFPKFKKPCKCEELDSIYTLTGWPPHQRWFSFSLPLKWKLASNTGSCIEFPTIP